MAQLIAPAAPRGRMAGPISLAAILLLCLLAAPPALATGAGPAAKKVLAPAAAIRPVSDAAYGDTLSALIAGAEQRIDLAMFLFKTGPARDNRPAGLIRDLVAARQRGVEVRVILEYSGRDPTLDRANQETAQALRKGGVAVFFDSPERTTHAKLAVIDRRHCLVGSHNLTQSALKYNREFSLLLDSPPLAEEILAYLETILK